MKYFVCALGKVYIAIPTERTERIIPVTRIQTVVYETDGGEAFISIPVLLQQKSTIAHHGLILKPDTAGTALKIILVTPHIDIDMEMQEEDIHGLPEVLAGLCRYFRGAYFYRESVILVLNIEKLMETLL